MPTTPPIRGFFGRHRWLSNFFIEPDGSHVEGEYQRAKVDASRFEQREWFTGKTPAQCKAIGRKVALREDWEDVKVEVMLFYVRKKFRDHRALAIALINTGDAHLEEVNTWGDTYWGTCNGQGLNMLGDILMCVRGELLEAEFERLRREQ